MLRWIFLLALSPLFTACMTLSGNYKVEAQDDQGTPLSNINMVAEGSGIYTVRNALCSAHPGAIIRITDINTGQELKSESPYQCRGKLKPAAPAYQEPWSFEFDGRVWVVGNQGANKNMAAREYILDGEDIKNWSELVTSAYYFIDPASDNAKRIHQAGGVGQIMVSTYNKEFSKNCKQVVINIIESIPEDMLLEWHHQGCTDHPAQHQIQRIIDTHAGALSLSYVKKTQKLDSATRQQWIDLLRAASHSEPL